MKKIGRRGEEERRRRGETEKPEATVLRFSVSPLLPISIFLFAFLLYLNTLNHGFVMDDGAVITDNVTVQKGFSGINELFHQSSVYGSTKENFGTYRPLTMSLFAIEWQIFENNPSRYHLVHVLLYALCCVVLFLTLKKLLMQFHPLIPFVAVLLFVAHPIHTEVGSNIKSVDEILSLMFCMGALYFAIASKMQLTATNEITKPRRGFKPRRGYNITLSWLCFGAALFSKENSITFLAIIPLASGLLIRTQNPLNPDTEHHSPFRKYFYLIPYFLLAIFYLYIRNAVLDKTPETMNIVNNALAGATSFSEKFGTIFYILLYYIRLLVFPHPLSWDYSFNQIPLVTFSNIFSILSVLFYTGIAVYAVVQVGGLLLPHMRDRNDSIEIEERKKKLTTSNLISFCILFFLITLSVSSNIFVLIAATMAERFLFIPSVAFCILLAIVITAIIPRRGSEPRRGFNNILVFILIPMLIIYSIKTWSRNKDWKSNYTLFGAGVKTSPDSYRANSSFGWQNLQEGQKDPQSEKGKEYFTTARTYYQRAVAIYGKAPDDWFNLGVTNSALGNTDEVMKDYHQALAVRPNHRNSAYNLATIYFSQKNFAESLKYFQVAYEADTTFFDALFKTGVSQHMLGNMPEAIRVFEKCIVLNPTSKDAITNLSIEYRMVGNNGKADYFSEKLKQMK